MADESGVERVGTLLLELYREGEQSPPPMPELHTRRRVPLRWALATVVTAAAVIAAVIALGPGQDTSVQQLTPIATPSPSPVSAQDPLKLVGLWTVRDARPDATPKPAKFAVNAIRLGADLTAFTPCAEFFGSWLADEQGSFVAGAGVGSGACFYDSAAPDVSQLPTWLQGTTSYEFEGGDVLLYDADHNLTARLTPGADVETRPDFDPSLTQAPTLDAAIRENLKAPKPPTPGKSDVTMPEVAGRWLPLPRHRYNELAYLQLNSDGSWSGLDGCNGAGGRWLLETNGELLATSGVTSAVGCNNAPSSLAGARNVRLVGGKLLLYDVDARLLATFVRS